MSYSEEDSFEDDDNNNDNIFENEIIDDDMEFKLDISKKVIGRLRNYCLYNGLNMLSSNNTIYNMADKL